MVERKLLFYHHSENHPERHYWNFLIINEPREIRQIKDKLHEQLVMIVNEQVIDSGAVSNSGGLYYELLEIESTATKIDFAKVYQGEVKRDRRLQPRRTPSGWVNFIQDTAEGRI